STERPARGELAMFVRDTPATRFTLRVRAVHRGRQAEGATPASGDLWVRVEGEATRVRAGDADRVRGQAFGIGAALNPGERDFRPRARERNIAGRLLAPSPALVTPAENFEGGLLSRWVRLREALRARSSSWIDSASVSDGARAMLHAGLL